MFTTLLSDEAMEAEDGPAFVQPSRKPSIVESPPLERHGYQSSRGSRIFGGVGTLSIIPLILIVAIVSLEDAHRHKLAPPPLTVTMVPTAAPPQPETKVEPQKTIEKQVKPIEPKPMPALLPPIMPLPVPQVAAPVLRTAPDPRPQPVEITPPAPPAAAPAQAPSHANKGPDRWEGRVLARLEQYRHYPSEAKRARQQGTVLVRFRMERSGHVLSSSIERSSGNAMLDQAAMETLRSADPLPKIPADRADQIELVVPIEFTIAR